LSEQDFVEAHVMVSELAAIVDVMAAVDHYDDLREHSMHDCLLHVEGQLRTVSALLDNGRMRKRGAAEKGGDA
jgi:hypothetical protein